MLTEVQIRFFYEAIARKLTNYLIANGSDYASACDIVQEAFLRLWRKRADFTEKDSVSGFLFAVARNLKIDTFRRNKFYVFQEEIKDGSLETIEPENTMDELAYLRKRLQAALARIPGKLRTAYTLFQVGKCSIREIAVQTGASESLVKVRIHRARNKLQELLADLH